MGNFVDFDMTELKADPAVRSLVSQVGERVGEKRLTVKERRKKTREREKAVARGRRGIVRWAVEVHPEVKAEVSRVAGELGVPVSQVVNELLVMALERGQNGLVGELEEKREIGKNGSRRFDYFIAYRGVPKKTKGCP